MKQKVDILFQDINAEICKAFCGLTHIKVRKTYVPSESKTEL